MVEAIRDVDTVVVVGYSFPKEDQYGRFLLKEGMALRNSGLTVEFFELQDRRSEREEAIRDAFGSRVENLRYRGEVEAPRITKTAGGERTMARNAAEALKKKFGRVKQDIDKIQRDIHQKPGSFGILHDYTVDQLLERKNFVSAMINKIADDVKGWEGRGCLSKEDVERYHEYREDAEENALRLEEEIRRHQDTFLEEVWMNVKRMIPDALWAIFGKIWKRLSGPNIGLIPYKP